MKHGDEREFAAEIEHLEADSATMRLAALQTLYRADAAGLRSGRFGADVNNHVHTRYSFSPYAPAHVAYQARRAGLRVVGSVDHDSIGAAAELRDAARALGMGATVGAELRVSLAETPFADRMINNPDMRGNAYMVLHAVPAVSWDALGAWLSSRVAAREQRNRRQVALLNREVGALFGELDYERDVRPISWVARGGSVTERHILYALAMRALQVESDAVGLTRLIEQAVGQRLSPQIAARVADPANPHRSYDILGAFKSSLVPKIFIEPDRTECAPLAEAVDLAQRLGAIPAYAYLGDIETSATGDKRAQRFEDAYLDELVAYLETTGVRAITYMPPRNSAAQLERVQDLCRRHRLLEISGVDINSSRQSFLCPEARAPQFRHLVESTWALVGHEIASDGDPAAGLFGSAAPVARAPLAERVAHFAAIGRANCPAGIAP